MDDKREKQYIQRILDGETELFGFFLDRYSRPVYALVTPIVSSREDAEELVQDVFLKAFQHLSRYKGDASFSTWIYRIAYNAAVSFTRKRRQEYHYIEEDAINNVPDEKANSLLESTDDEERIACLMRAIEKLDPEEKTLITLFYYEERPITAIGEVLGLTLSNVKTKLHRTRKKIYLLMNKE